MHLKYISIRFESELQVLHSLLSTCYLFLLTVYHLPITKYHLPTTNFPICKLVILRELNGEGESGDKDNLVGWLLYCGHLVYLIKHQTNGGVGTLCFESGPAPLQPYRTKSTMKKQWTFSAKVLCPFPIDFEKIEMDK